LELLIQLIAELSRRQERSTSLCTKQ